MKRSTRPAQEFGTWSDGNHVYERHRSIRRIGVTELNKDEKIVSTRSSFNVANTIAAIALLLLVLGALKYFGVSPI